MAPDYDPSVSRGDQQVPGHGTPVGVQTFSPAANAPSVPSNATPDEAFLGDKESDEVDATDAAVARAEELDVNLAEVDGSGADGRITAADVEFAAESND
jgi:pyruvate/2-oxoglutarate dehydrogenase complex dihydrolipoamide acyltransferase (E2) component